ncbi:hypothetical protein TRAPUB_6002 [Trametes pubescens]|uniref:Uncharacterized protein n=1 Tax=Trametes pubescens TaxID=154538 RepID=A0A1M2V738_TRAPU|nr:hypothetical protein TRAPUB_6002 [Trametes pubescens]
MCDIPSPAISTASSSGSVFPLSPMLLPNPERSLKQASSFATTISASAPITPANDDPSSPTIAPPTPHSDRAPSPIHLDHLAKQLVTGAPILIGHSKDFGTYPPAVLAEAGNISNGIADGMAVRTSQVSDEVMHG